jgi:hypothetical protein
VVFFDVKRLRRVTVFGFEFRRHVADPLADFIFHEFDRLSWNVETFRPLLDHALRGFPGAIVIDYRIAYHAMEPGNYPFLVAQGRGFLHSTNKSRLQDVFGDRARLGAFSRKRRKSLWRASN